MVGVSERLHPQRRIEEIPVVVNDDDDDFIVGPAKSKVAANVATSCSSNCNTSTMGENQLVDKMMISKSTRGQWLPWRRFFTKSKFMVAMVCLQLLVPSIISVLFQRDLRYITDTF